MIRILGISAYYHDSAACLTEDGRVVAAMQEERLSRIKHDNSFPSLAVEYCLREAGVGIDQIDYIAFYDKPFLKFERILETYMQFAPKGIGSFLKAIPVWIKNKLWIKEHIAKNLGFAGPILFPEHHFSHAASAFFASPFDKAAFLTTDGVGEWTTTSFGIGRRNKIDILSDIKFPHSLGLLYSAFTYFTGFKVNSGEYKMMGLAPFGEPKYKKHIYDNLIDLKSDGSFRLNLEYFNYCTGLTMTNRKFARLFGVQPRKAEGDISQIYMDIARSIQEVTEEVYLAMAYHIKNTTGMKNLCLAGGVALNCVANGKLQKEKVFDSIWIQPAAGDAGGALGAALSVWYQHLKNNRKFEGLNECMSGAFLGPEYSNESIKSELDKFGLSYENISPNELLERTAELINDQKIIGWFQGRLEFGPRALGSRSILADARSPKMQSLINQEIKFRESFRPFAPAILAEKAGEYFEIETPSPYMLQTAKLKNQHLLKLGENDEATIGLAKLQVNRSTIPAVTHVDNSARVQTVHKETNRMFYDLLKVMNDKYGCPLVVNTSFNVRGEPIVCSPEDGIKCFLNTGMDYLVIGNFIVAKNHNSEVVQ